jgi:phage tail sheath gpL-like
MLKKTLAIAALAFLAVVGTPLAANAAGYVPSSNVTVSGTVTAGGTVTVSFAAGSFTSGETVSFSVTGSGTATISAFRAATVTATKVATSSGAVSANVTLPANATGTYTLTATGLTSGNIGTAALTVVPADPGTAAALPHTGSTLPMLLIWIAGGAVALGLALYLVLGLVRRQRARA